MKCILRTILYYSAFISFFGCSNNLSSTDPDNPSGVVSQPSIFRNFDPNLISTLQDEQKRSVKLNDLVKDVENATFYINDNIVFSEDEEEEQENKDITLHIQTQCIESETQKKFTKNVSVDYKNEIMLIELIPEQLFSYGNSWWLNEETYNPTCSFHFEARNKAGDIHYFELPHLPVLSFDNSLNLSLIEQQVPSNEVERVAQFPVLNFDQIANYAVISGRSTTVDQLKLICETFDLSFDVDNLIHYDLWKLQGWASIEKEDRINQPCRFVSFNDEHIVGISQLFPIVFPATQGMTIQMITDSREINDLKDKYPLSASGYDFHGISQMRSDFKKDHNLGSYHNLAVLKIENLNIDTIHLYIPDTSFQADTHFFYDNFLHGVLIENRENIMKNQGVFVTMPDSAEFTLNPSLIKAKDHRMEINDEGLHMVYEDNYALLTLTAGATALIPLSVNIEQQCDFKDNWSGEQRRLRMMRNIGMVFEGNLFPIYRVLDVTDVESAQKTIISSITEASHQTDDFRLDVGLTPTRRRIDKHFYKNTCTALETSRFDQKSVAHQGTWKVKSKNRSFQFTKDSEHSLSQAENRFINERVKRYLENKQLARRN